jgi:Kef-type K+ transport system membrane component KefB
MLEPSLLGLVAPDVAIMLFPAQTLPFLDVLSQVGLIFFMFLIGLELDPKYLKSNLDIAILTSHVSILVSFSLGTLLAVLLYPLVSTANVSFTAFALFLGAAMSPTGDANHLTGVVATVGEALLYIGFMVTAGRWFLRKLSK